MCKQAVRSGLSEYCKRIEAHLKVGEVIVGEELKRTEWKMDYLHAFYIMYKIIEQ